MPQLVRAGEGGDMHHQDENHEIIEKALNLLGLNQSMTRRSFFRLSGITVVGVSALVSLGAKSGKEMPVIIMDTITSITVKPLWLFIVCLDIETLPVYLVTLQSCYVPVVMSYRDSNFLNKTIA